MEDVEDFSWWSWILDYLEYDSVAIPKGDFLFVVCMGYLSYIFAVLLLSC